MSWIGLRTNLYFGGSTSQPLEKTEVKIPDWQKPAPTCSSRVGSHEGSCQPETFVSIFSRESSQWAAPWTRPRWAASNITCTLDPGSEEGYTWEAAGSGGVCMFMYVHAPPQCSSYPRCPSNIMVILLLGDTTPPK